MCFPHAPIPFLRLEVDKASTNFYLSPIFSDHVALNSNMTFKVVFRCVSLTFTVQRYLPPTPEFQTLLTDRDYCIPSPIRYLTYEHSHPLSFPYTPWNLTIPLYHPWNPSNLFRNTLTFSLELLKSQEPPNASPALPFIPDTKTILPAPAIRRPNGSTPDHTHP